MKLEDIREQVYYITKACPKIKSVEFELSMSEVMNLCWELKDLPLNIGEAHINHDGIRLTCSGVNVLISTSKIDFKTPDTQAYNGTKISDYFKDELK